jgi:hypothetical protein
MASALGQEWGPLAVVRAEPGGKWSAAVVGLPEISVSGGETREQTLEQVQRLLQEQLASGQLVALRLTNPLVQQAGWAKDDPTYPEFLDELRRPREELDREQQPVEGP